MAAIIQEADRTATGLPSVGSVDWGAHFCLFYRSASDLIEAAAAFFAAGLRNGERCLWIMSGIERADARAALAATVPDLAVREHRRDIQILDQEEWYTQSGGLDRDATLQAWLDSERNALDGGYTGLRISGDTSWLERDMWQSFSEYEACVHRVFDRRRIVALCSYSLERCRTEDVLDVLRHHEFALLRRRGTWESVRSATLLVDALGAAERAGRTEDGRLAEVEERSARALQKATAALAAPVTKDRVERCVQALAEVVGASRIFIERAAGRRRSGQRRPAGAPAGDQLAAAPRWLTAPNEIAAAYPQLQGSSALAAVPLGVRAYSIGTLLAVYDVPASFDVQQRALLEDVAQQAALAFERAALYEEAERQRQRERAASRAKDEYIAMLGHELRNPLAALQAAVEVLKLADGEDKRRAWHGVVERQVTHMAHIIEDVLDVSRITHGKLKIDLARLDLGAVLRRAVEDMQGEIARRGLTLEQDITAGIFVDGSVIRLTQVFHNLLDNAAKFTSAPGRIRATCRTDGREAHIIIADTGIGIDAALLAHVFEPFTQGPQDRARSNGGLGLGLALAQQIAELHKGSLRAASAGPGAGAELTLTLPLAEWQPPGDVPGPTGPSEVPQQPPDDPPPMPPDEVPNGTPPDELPERESE